MMEEIAKSNENTLIIGETGTGKKLIAQEIQAQSKQKNKPFVVLNCKEVGDTISETEIYGEIIDGPRGIERQIGIFEQARGGILYLDHIDGLKPEFQQKFFNIFKEHRFRKPGENNFIETEFRVVSATTNEKLLVDDTFRRDLMVLLNTFTLHIPPLRNRKQDIPILFTHFLEQCCDEFHREIPPVASNIFESVLEYEWPGNIFELQNSVRNLVAMSPEGKLSISYLPFEVKRHPFELLEGHELPEAVSEVEKYLIKKALGRFAGNQSKAAHALNVSEAALRYKMRKYGLVKAAF